MPPKSERPIYRTNLNLYLSDVQVLERVYGHGWSGVVRDLVAEHVKDLQPKKLTVGDLLKGRDDGQ